MPLSPSALLGELERLDDLHPNLCHAVIWPATGWREGLKQPADRFWNQALHHGAGTRLRWSGGFLSIDKTPVAASFFDSGTPVGLSGSATHHAAALAVDPERSAQFAEGIQQIRRVAEAIAPMHGGWLHKVDRPYLPYTEDRWLELLYSALSPPVEDRQFLDGSSWQFRQLQSGVFAASATVAKHLFGPPDGYVRLTTSEAAIHVFGQSKGKTESKQRLVRQWIKNGKLPAVKVKGTLYDFRKDVLDLLKGLK